jgi:hypothetical protein
MAGKTKKLELMKSFADVLRQKEMTEGECIKFLGMTQPNFRTFITSMSEIYLVYEYKNEKRNVIYGILK